jgi:hypothetical protein
MYICNSCGRLIDELPTSSQCHGYTGLGDELREEFAETECYCGSEFVEARQCKICGGYYSDEDYPYDVCECCAEEYQSLKIALEIGSNNTEKINVNGFVAHMLTEEEINKILTKHILDNFAEDKTNVSDYCKNDMDYFADLIIEKEAERKG